MSDDECMRYTYRLRISTTACGTSLPRDKNSAHVMLVRAGFVPAGVEGVSPGRPQGAQVA